MGTPQLAEPSSAISLVKDAPERAFSKVRGTLSEAVHRSRDSSEEGFFFLFLLPFFFGEDKLKFCFEEDDDIGDDDDKDKEKKPIASEGHELSEDIQESTPFASTGGMKTLFFFFCIKVKQMVKDDFFFAFTIFLFFSDFS